MVHKKFYFKEYDESNIEKLSQDTHGLCQELLDLGHWINKDHMTNFYILPNYMPLVSVSFYSSFDLIGWDKTIDGMVRLQVQHFFDEEKKFPEIEKLVEKYQLEELK